MLLVQGIHAAGRGQLTLTSPTRFDLGAYEGGKNCVATDRSSVLQTDDFSWKRTAACVFCLTDHNVETILRMTPALPGYF